MSAVLFDRSADVGRLELTDQHRLDLLHRMSTNDMNSLQPGQGCSTVLTTALGRIIDRVTVYHRGETALMLTAHLQTVRNWLQRHIFWQDRVRLKDVSAELGQLELYGPEANALIETVSPGASGLALHHFQEAERLLIARTFPLNSAGFILIASPARLETLRETLLRDGQVAFGDGLAYERLRIRAGMPGPGHEITEEFIPLEANLWESVSFRKGCYIGQEIIARMESRGKLAKTLVALRLNGEARLGARLLAGEQPVGTLTSLIQDDAGGWIGLGFVKPELARIGAPFNVEDHPTISAEIAPAPLITLSGPRG